MPKELSKMRFAGFRADSAPRPEGQFRTGSGSYVILGKDQEQLAQLHGGAQRPDELSFAILIVALVLMLVSSFTGSWVLNFLSLAVYIWLLFRMFSKNLEKRYAENQKYLKMRAAAKTKLSQAFVRLKNVRKYKYFKCPDCHTLLRLPRNVGEVTVTCGKCRHSLSIRRNKGRGRPSPFCVRHQHF